TISCARTGERIKKQVCSARRGNGCRDMYREQKKGKNVPPKSVRETGNRCEDTYCEWKSEKECPDEERTRDGKPLRRHGSVTRDERIE
ncbi:MAG: hypothetical protein IJG15_03325, partial [Lachnospiraceae bacterium]|nr:hypothetical protein [Lachnospiraceae bacterium]